MKNLVGNRLFEEKVHYHCKNKHGHGFYKIKGIIKRLLFLIPSVLINIIALILWSLTYPFWWIHEFIS